jgi:hypothetical protein
MEANRGNRNKFCNGQIGGNEGLPGGEVDGRQQLAEGAMSAICWIPCGLDYGTCA